MTKATNNFLVCALIAVTLTALLACYLWQSVQFNVVNITVRVQTIEAVSAIVSEIDGRGRETELARLAFDGNQGAGAQNVTTAPLNKPVRRLKVKLVPVNSEQGTAVILHEVFLYPSYGDDEVYLHAARINQEFDVSAPAKEKNNYYELGAGETLSFTSTQRVIRSNLTFVGPISLFIFIIVFSIARQLHWRALPAFQDLNLGQQISSKHEFNTINGLRGLAALLVLFSHSAPGWENLQIGIGILFVISGFLLSKPFVLDKHRIFSIRNIETFWQKRIKRILPMYFVFVFLSYGLNAQLDSLWRHMLFVQASGHLWPMTQIFVFYMLLPLFLLVTCFADQVHRLLPIVILVVAIGLWLMFLSDWKPFYNGFYYHEFYLYAFLMGILASYLQFGLLSNFLDQESYSQVRQPLGWFSFVFGMLLILWSGPLQPPVFLQAYFGQFFFKCVGCMILILLAINTPATWFNRILANRMFQTIGIVGFSFYLLHGFGIEFSSELLRQIFGLSYDGNRHWLITLSAFVVTLVLSLLSYSFIERRFFGRQHRQSAKVV